MTPQVARLGGPRNIEIETVPDAELPAESVRIAVEYAGICGSDLHFYEAGAAAPGTAFGHEIVGTVVGSGRGASDAWIGKRVVVSPYVFCGACEFCSAGSPANCSRRAPSFECGFSSTVDAKIGPGQNNVFEVPAHVSSRTAVLAEPTSVAVRAVKQALRASRTRGRTSPVLVLGAGPIGLLVTAVLRAEGFSEVWVLDRNQGRLNLARSVGATAAYSSIEALDDALRDLPKRDPAIVDTGSLPPIRYIFECSGAEPLLRRAAHEWLGRAGVIAQVGVFGGEVSVSLDSLLRKEATLVTSYAYSPQDWPEALELLSAPDSVLPSIVREFEGVEMLKYVMEGVQDGSIIHKPVIAC